MKPIIIKSDLVKLSKLGAYDLLKPIRVSKLLVVPYHQVLQLFKDGSLDNLSVGKHYITNVNKLTKYVAMNLIKERSNTNQAKLIADLTIKNAKLSKRVIELTEQVSELVEQLTELIKPKQLTLNEQTKLF